MATLKDLLVNGNSSLLGTTTAVNILPQTDANYNLGSSGFGWNTIYLDKSLDNNAHHQGISFLDDTNEVAHIGTDSTGIAIYGNNAVYIRPSLTATNQGFTVTSTAINPAANGTIDLGYHNTTDNTDLYRWKSLYLKATNSSPGIDYLMDSNSSAARYIVNLKNTSNEHIGGIGFWNTGDTNGVIYLIPHSHTGENGYSGTVGLWIGKNNLKWENKYLLRYSATATTNLLLIADGTAGNVKTSGKTITTDAPTSSSGDTTIPTSAAVWSAASAAADDRLPIYYSAPNFSSNARSTGLYSLSGLTHPVSGEAEYGSVLWSLERAKTGSTAESRGYATLLIISSLTSTATDPYTHAYIRRLFGSAISPGWTGWSSIIDNHNLYNNFTSIIMPVSVTPIGSSNTESWFKVYEHTTTAAGSENLILLVNDGYNNTTALVRFYFNRTNNGTCSGSARWITSSNFASTRMVYEIDNTNKRFAIYVYNFDTNENNSICVTMLKNTNRYGNFNPDLTLYFLNPAVKVDTLPEGVENNTPLTHYATRAGISTTVNAIAKYAGTTGEFANSGVTIDANNNLSTAGNITGNEITTSKLYIYGNKTSNKTNRFLYSDALTNIYVSIDGVLPLVMTNAEVRRGASATSVNLGSSSYPWNNIYGNNFYGSGSNLTSLNATNLASGTVAFARLPSLYAGTTAITSAASYKTTPEVATIKINGDTSASTASTKNCTLQYDSTLQTLKFVFA